jgi:hypothetical protein
LLEVVDPSRIDRVGRDGDVETAGGSATALDQIAVLVDKPVPLVSTFFLRSCGLPYRVVTGEATETQWPETSGGDHEGLDCGDELGCLARAGLDRCAGCATSSARR